MKLTFKIHGLVTALVTATHKAIDLNKVTQACEAFRNNVGEFKDKGMIESDVKSDRRLRIAGGKDSRRSEEKETLKIMRTGPDSVVARFMAYNDEVRILEERAAKNVSGKLTLAPDGLNEFNSWLVKFCPAQKSAPKAPKAPANGNGAHAETPEPVNRLETAKA